MASSVLALVVSGLNAYNLSEDRKDQTRKAALDSQVSLAKLYFDRLPSGNTCESSNDKLLFAKTAVTIAGLSFEKMFADYQINADLPLVPIDEENHELRGLARVLFADIVPKMRGCGDANVKVSSAPAAPVQVAARTEGSTYQFREQVPTQASLTSTKLTVYIQYKKGNAAAFDRAKNLQNLLKSKGFNAPGTEGVLTVPDHDQLRIYKADNQSQDTAAQLKKEGGLADAQIVDLSKAYPNLPSGIIEVWLGSGG